MFEKNLTAISPLAARRYTEIKCARSKWRPNCSLSTPCPTVIHAYSAQARN